MVSLSLRRSNNMTLGEKDLIGATFDFGTAVLVVGGNGIYHGAPLLSTLAALRLG
jgi:NAD(P)H-hydrate repair Nnr-like enzyme with NAD(P)H-hydrate dehydratase domain